MFPEHEARVKKRLRKKRGVPGHAQRPLRHGMGAEEQLANGERAGLCDQTLKPGAYDRPRGAAIYLLTPTENIVRL